MTPDEYRKAVASGAPIHIRVNGKPEIKGLVYLRTVAAQPLLPVLKQAVQKQFGGAFIIGNEDGTLEIAPVEDESIDFLVLDFGALLKPGRK